MKKFKFFLLKGLAPSFIRFKILKQTLAENLSTHEFVQIVSSFV